MEVDKLTEGFHPNVPMDQYVKDPCPEASLSAGVMNALVTRSPAHAWVKHPRLNPAWAEEESGRADLGTALHAAILGGEEIVYAPEGFEDWRKKEAQTFRNNARENGQIALLAHQRVEIETAAESGRAALEAVAEGTKRILEHVMIWRDGKVWKRARPDVWLPEVQTMVDVKTVIDADPDKWIRQSLAAGGYDVQCEHYLDGVRTLGLAKEARFLFLLVELEPPHCTAWVALDPEYAAIAQKKVKLATKMWADCMAEDHWPGYTQSVHWATPSPWMEGDVMMRADLYEREQEKGEEAGGPA